MDGGKKKNPASRGAGSWGKAVSPGPHGRAAAGAERLPAVPRSESVKHDWLVHQDVELAEEFIDILERRLFFDQFLHSLSKLRGERPVDENLPLRVLVDDLVAARL